MDADVIPSRSRRWELAEIRATLEPINKRLIFNGFVIATFRGDFLDAGMDMLTPPTIGL